MQSTEAKSISRRQFLRGNFRKKADAIRPPWALQESDFAITCTKCNSCISKCPENIIARDEDGFPAIDFNRGGCTFCQECVTACQEDALSMSYPEQLPWNMTATISSKCISLQGVMCRSCGDSCEEDAISFRLQVGGISQPEINTKSCTGCGFCVVTCPVKAIKITENKAHEEYDYEHN
jgi:ferredoxin-type protein NapF